MGLAYFEGDAYTPQSGLKGLATFGRTAGGVWLPLLVSSSGAAVSSLMDATILDVTPVTDTGALADGDIAFNATEITNAVRANGAAAKLESIDLIDEDDQTGYAMDLVFMDAASSLGTLNNAPSLSDALSRTVLGIVNVPAASKIDLGGSDHYFVRNVGLMLKATAATRSIWVAGINRTGTPTFTASGLKLKLGVTWY